MADDPSAWQHTRAILQLPFMVTVVVPACLVFLGRGRAAFPWLPPGFLWALGAALLLAGLGLVVSTVRLLSSLGGGTLAPWDPTVHLVVAGPYQHVRNPMISGVFAVLLGEALVFNSVALLLWFCGFVIANLFYMPLSEEPALRRRFGADYQAYTENVPAWIPRRTAWRASK